MNTDTVAARTCLVTGAGRGIGREIVHRLAADGHRIAVMSRSQGDLDRVCGEVAAPTLAIAADVTHPADVERAFSVTEQTFGPVEILIAAAGSGLGAPLVQTTDELWQQMIDVNLTAPFRCLRRALPSMIERRFGRIVVIASVAAKRGEPLISAYAASKHGVLGLVRSAAIELARTGVTVNAVCPGYVDTPMTDASIAAIAERTGKSSNEASALLARKQPVGRLVTVAEVATAVQFCLDNPMVTGQGINVDGGAIQS